MLPPLSVAAPILEGPVGVLKVPFEMDSSIAWPTRGAPVPGNWRWMSSVALPTKELLLLVSPTLSCGGDEPHPSSLVEPRVEVVVRRKNPGVHRRGGSSPHNGVVKDLGCCCGLIGRELALVDRSTSRTPGLRFKAKPGAFQSPPAPDGAPPGDCGSIPSQIRTTTRR